MTTFPKCVHQSLDNLQNKDAKEFIDLQMQVGQLAIQLLSLRQRIEDFKVQNRSKTVLDLLEQLECKERTTTTEYNTLQSKLLNLWICLI